MPEFACAASLQPAGDDCFLITFRDVPEACAECLDVNAAHSLGLKSLLPALNQRLRWGRALPLSPALHPGEFLIYLPFTVCAKVLLCTELARLGFALPSAEGRLRAAVRLQMPLVEFERLADLNHHSRIETIERAFARLGLVLQPALQVQ
ncbi:MAG: hypothetical protein IAB19_05990 [Proteobacteria bacterium]|uniref:Uncharacterized protein n=1 Tax=Candidatus Avisuccinivibrio stercorigallinarum TaxID=2840704 RepID=A0A9D9GQ68_9GAMM|nr:hypothetical protein [Candidatus Avisuccinivibrio stercorigallinarum]